MGGVQTGKALHLVGKAAVLVASLQQLTPHSVEPLMMLMQQLPVLLPYLHDSHVIMIYLIDETHAACCALATGAWLAAARGLPSHGLHWQTWHKGLASACSVPSKMCSSFAKCSSLSWTVDKNNTLRIKSNKEGKTMQTRKQAPHHQVMTPPPDSSAEHN